MSRSSFRLSVVIFREDKKKHILIKILTQILAERYGDDL